MARGSRKALEQTTRNLHKRLRIELKIRLMKVSILKDWLGIIKLSMI
jgi:hypothetical protein